MNRRSTDRGDHLLGIVLADGNGDASYELLQEFFAGYPVDRLRLLLGSEHDRAAEAGVWIASELGVDAAPLLDDLVALLQHSSAAVRFYAADSIFGSAGDDRGDATAEAIRLIDDPDRGVRWKVMDSLARADRAQLLAGAAHLDGAEYPLLTMLRDDGHGLVRIATEGGDRERRFAAAAAGRQAIGGDVEALNAIAKHGGVEIKKFATDLLRNVRIARGARGSP